MIEEREDLREGFLVKCGHFVKNWKKRFFVLKAHEIAYYTDDKKQTFKGVYQLDTSCKIERLENIKGRPFCFSLNAPGRSQGGSYDSITMQAQTKEELESWISAINEIIDPRPPVSSPKLTNIFADVSVPVEEQTEEKVVEVKNEAPKIEADVTPPGENIEENEIDKVTNYDLENFIAEGWVLKREGEGGIYHNRYAWIDTFEKTLHWAKEDDKYGPSKSIPLSDCRTSDVKQAKQQRRASFVGTADTPGFSFSIINATEGAEHPVVGLKLVVEGAAEKWREAIMNMTNTDNIKTESGDAPPAVTEPSEGSAGEVTIPASKVEENEANISLDGPREGWVLKREGEGGIYHMRYVWIDISNKTLHWAKEENKQSSKSIPLSDCRTSDVKQAKQQRRASFVGTADTPGFSFSIINATEGAEHPVVGLKFPTEVEANAWTYTIRKAAQ